VIQVAKAFRKHELLAEAMTELHTVQKNMREAKRQKQLNSYA
jgi:hypothetical protein